MVNDRRAYGDPLAKETAQMTFEKGLTPRQLFFLSAAYMLSGAFIFRTRGVFTLAVSFLLWTVISGATVILKNRKPDILSGGVFSAVLAATCAFTAALDIFALYGFSSVHESGVSTLVFIFSSVAVCVFFFTEIKLLGRLSELAPYLFAIATLTSLPYLRISLSAFDGGYIFPCFFPAVPIILCSEACDAASSPSPSLAANKNIGKPFFCSLFGALSGTLLYIPFSASNFSENGILLVFIWSTAFLRLSCDFFSIARLCREKHGFLPAAAFSAFVFFAFFCISKTPPV